jgi:DNA-binding CsgD family transcriptional regulator
MPLVSWLVLLVGILALALGISSLTVVGLLYRRYRHRLLTRYFVVFGAVTLLFFNEIAAFLVSLVSAANPLGLSPMDVTTSVIFYLLCGGIGFFLPALTMTVVGRAWPALRVVVAIAASIFPAGVVLYFAAGVDLSIAADGLFLALLFLALGILNRNIQRIAVPDLRRFAQSLLTVTVVFAPLFVVQIYGSVIIPALPDWFAETPHFFVVFYLLWSILNIVYASRAFFSPRPTEVFDVPDSFTGTYGLTEREAVVAAAVLRGASNKEIGYELGISDKTVKNHLYSTFQKAGVHSRVQLLRRIDSFRA